MGVRSELTELRMKILERELAEISLELIRQGITDPELRLLDHSQFLRLFMISVNTSKNWRDQGLIPYSRINGKIYFKVSDLRKMIRDHRILRNRSPDRH